MLQVYNSQLNTSIDMLYQQLSQQSASIDSTRQQLNTSIDMLYSQQNASINSAAAYQQLNEEVYRQLNTSGYVTSITIMEAHQLKRLNSTYYRNGL